MIIITTLPTDLVSSISDFFKKKIWNLVPNWTDNSQKKVSLFIFDFHYIFNEPKKYLDSGLTEQIYKLRTF